MKLFSSFNKINLVPDSWVISANVIEVCTSSLSPGLVPIGDYFMEDAQLGEEGYIPGGYTQYCLSQDNVH